MRGDGSGGDWGGDSDGGGDSDSDGDSDGGVSHDELKRMNRTAGEGW